MDEIHFRSQNEQKSLFKSFGVKVARASLEAKHASKKRRNAHMASKGSLTEILTDEDVEQLLEQACAELAVTGKRVLVIIPDGTRTCPLPLMFRLLYKHLGHRVRQLDYLVALGTHQPM